MYKYVLDILCVKHPQFKVTLFIFSNYNHESVILVIRKFSKQKVCSYFMKNDLIYKEFLFAKFQILIKHT